MKNQINFLEKGESYIKPLKLKEIAFKLELHESTISRISSNKFKRFSFMDYPNLTFERPDLKTFKNLDLAYLAMRKGGNMPCILNAANEIAVAAFLEDRIGFLNMSDLIGNCMEKITFVANPSLEDYEDYQPKSKMTVTEIMETVGLDPYNDTTGVKFSLKVFSGFEITFLTPNQADR